MKPSKYEPGQRVRIVLPSSRLHGVVAECVRQVPPLGWWILKSDKPLEVGEGEDTSHELMAPELWFEPVPKRSPRSRSRRAARNA